VASTKTPLPPIFSRQARRMGRCTRLASVPGLSIKRGPPAVEQPSALYWCSSKRRSELRGLGGPARQANRLMPRGCEA